MKIRKRLIVLAFLAVAFISAMAQKQQFDYTIYGVVEDSITHEGEPYATLSIYRKGHEEKAVQMAVTDANGKFKVTSKGEGDYVLEVKSVSRTPLRRFFTVSKQSRSQNLGTLLVSDSKTELKGVEVVAYKPLVKADIDKLTYSVEDDPESQTNTVMEMLKKVPMVSVDGQDNVKVNGSTSFKVYVNGKPNNMMTKNPKEVLKSMPATGIKKIEVITNPGPKYDAEGVAGILNIVTAGSGMEGYTATFSGNGGTRGGGGGLFATVKKGKFTMSVNYNSNFDNQGKATKVDLQSILDDEGNYLRTTTQDAHGKTKNQWHGGTLEASYEIDTLRLVSASFSMNRASWNIPGVGSFTSVAPYLDNKFLFSHDISGKNKGTYNDISAGIDYQRSFKTPGRLLTFSYRLESNPCTTLSDYRYTNLRTTADWADYTALLEDVRSDGEPEHYGAYLPAGLYHSVCQIPHDREPAQNIYCARTRRLMTGIRHCRRAARSRNTTPKTVRTTNTATTSSPHTSAMDCRWTNGRQDSDCAMSTHSRRWNICSAEVLTSAKTSTTSCRRQR